MKVRKSTIIVIAGYLALCAMILLIFGLLLFINYFVLISVWLINTLFYFGIVRRYKYRDQQGK